MQLDSSNPKPLEILFEELRHRRLISGRRIKGHLYEIRGRGRKGTVRLRDLRDVVGRLAARKRCGDDRNPRHKGSGTTRAKRQHELALPSGRKIRMDNAWVELLLRLEVDGRADHASYANSERDKATDMELRALGWDTARVTPGFVVERTAEFIAAIAATIEQRSRTLGRTTYTIVDWCAEAKCAPLSRQ